MREATETGVKMPLPYFGFQKSVKPTNHYLRIGPMDEWMTL